MNRPAQRQWKELLAMQQRLAHVEAERDALRAERDGYRQALERVAGFIPAVGTEREVVAMMTRIAATALHGESDVH